MSNTIDITMEGFLKNPNKNKLENDLDVINKMLEFQSQGYECEVKNGVAYYRVGKNNYEIGFVSDISSIKSELFGTREEPEGIEYTVVSAGMFYDTLRSINWMWLAGR